MASGDEDIIDSTRRLELQKQTGAQVVAWESAGLARACRQKNIPWAEIRMVSDLCDTESINNFHSTLSKGMPQIAHLLQKIF